MHCSARFLVLLLVTLPALFLALPLWAAEPQAPPPPGQVTPPTDTDWNNLQRLPLGALLLVEQTPEEPRLKGRLAGLADDAISLRRGKELVGVARPDVRRVWLLGSRRTAMATAVGAGIGLLTGLIAGTAAYKVCGGSAGEDCEIWFNVLLLPCLGAGAGLGAALGWHERTLIYRAPPPGTSPSAITLPLPAPHLSRPPAVDLLPAPLRDAYRTFSAEHVARELCRELARAHQPPDTAPQLTPKN